MKKKRIIATLMIMLLMLLMLAGCGSSDSKEGSGTEGSTAKEARATDEYTMVEEGGVRFQMPDYFEESEASGDIRNFYAETGNGMAVIQLWSGDGLFDEEHLASDTRDAYDSYTSGLTESGDVTDFQRGESGTMTLNCGVRSMIYGHSLKMNGIGLDTTMVMFNNAEAGKMIMVSLTQSEQSEYDYKSAFKTMVKSCEVSGAAPDQDEVPAPEEEPEQEEAEAEADDSSLISPEFKQTMDDYEAWFDHYCDVMKRMQENPTDIDILYEATDLMAEEAEMLEKMDNMDESEMNAAELAYYLEVTARIEKKLLEVADY